MASTGLDAWQKHFEGKGDVSTVMKKRTQLFTSEGAPAGYIEAGAPIVALDSFYDTKYPISYNNRKYLVTFNNIQKPISKKVSGIKLKPQDFKCFVKETWNVNELAAALIDEIEEREDLQPDLKTYATMLVKYWSKTDTSVTAESFRKLKQPDRGINELNKDFGEILGAMACIKHNILKDNKITSSSKMMFPLRGNEPLIDYYILGREKISVSAKSGSTTNTLKPSDILNLLESKRSSYRSQSLDLMRVIRDNTTVQFPFMAVNMFSKGILSDAAIEEAKKFKVSDFAQKNYSYELFEDLIKLIQIPGSSTRVPPSVGQIFYYTEKYIINKANTTPAYNPTAAFIEATKGQVIYVRFKITPTFPQGEFSVEISDSMDEKVQKQVKWRSKNATNRAADKLGVQP
jgi:hypothetical protein